ncbi:MAG: lytic transglycosylase domain-containing protein [Acetobacteraceae bacterium]
MPAGHAQGLGSTEDTAFAQPRIGAPFTTGGADLPQPLAPSDALRIRHIFTLQAQGNIAAAAAETGQLSNPVLNGHIEADRYLGRFTHASSAELATWLARYPDHPDASAIHALLVARLPHGAPVPPAPASEALPPEQPSAVAPEEDEPAALRLSRNPLLDRTVRERAHAGNADSALHLLTRTKGLSVLYGSQLQAEIAQALFTQGRDAQALRLAQNAFHQSDGRVGLAGYVAGLAAWRMQRTDLAQPLFEQASQAELNSTALRAGASFWAARAHLRNRDPAGYGPWMRQAAEGRRTFYGLLARRTLGMSTGFSSARDTLGAADTDALMATPHGLRAFALLQVGQPRRAEAELRHLWPAMQANPGLGGAVLRVAEAAGMMDFAAQVAGIIETAEGRPYDDARFPIPALRPAGGFRMDPALVYALTRLESNFDPDAVSAAGARGLMQVMPVTASYMAGDSASAASYARRLHDPATNLSVGQSYVLYLAQHAAVGGDLIRLLASYNAGPTSFSRMCDRIPPSDDPLLFIESIPNDETRGFVPRALAYSWIYAARLHLPAPSLDELAAGAWPTFHTFATRQQPVARLH